MCVRVHVCVCVCVRVCMCVCVCVVTVIYNQLQSCLLLLRSYTKLVWEVRTCRGSEVMGMILYCLIATDCLGLAMLLYLHLYAAQHLSAHIYSAVPQLI